MKKLLSLTAFLTFSSLASATSTGVYNCDMDDFYQTGTLLNINIRQSWGSLITAQLTIADPGGVSDTTFRGVVAQAKKGMQDVLKASEATYLEFPGQEGDETVSIENRKINYELTLNYAKATADGKLVKGDILSVKLKTIYDDTTSIVRNIPCVSVPSTNYKGKQ